MVWSFLSARWPMGSLTLTLSLFPSVLVDEPTAEYEVLLRIWAVCFSPDGKLLATAVGDGVVRVSFRTFVLVITTIVTIISEPSAQHGTTSGAPRFGISPRSES